MEIVMENKYQNEDRYFKAKKGVEEIKGFYGNLIAYTVVNIGFLTINLLTSPSHLWFFWSLLGWGIGVFSRYESLLIICHLGKTGKSKKLKSLWIK
jgi:hypothetical protein